MTTSLVLFNGLDADLNEALWVTNGTTAGTSELAVGLAWGGVDPQFITDYNGVALFTGNDAEGDYGLWATNGTAAGTSEIGGIGSTAITYANPQGLYPSDMFVYHGKVLFSGESGLAGQEYSGLWITDGTVAGTSEIGGGDNKGIKGAYGGGFLPGDPDFTLLNGKVLFTAEDSEGQIGLWATNGTAAGTVQLAPIAGAAFGGFVNPKGYDIDPRYTAVIGDEEIFAGNDLEDTAGSLWETNGTAAGTREIGGQGNKGIKDTPFTDPAGDLPDGMQPYGMTSYNGKVIFAAMDDAVIESGTYSHAFTLWETDGTAAGTTEIGGYGNSEITEANSAVNGGIFWYQSIEYPDFTVFNGKVLFVGYDTDNHVGLWETEGTAAGTTEIGGLDNAGIKGGLSLEDSNSPYFTVFGSEVLFVGVDSQNRADLWVTNGTAAGTSEVSTAPNMPYDADLTLYTNGPALYVAGHAQTPPAGSHLKAGEVVNVALDMSEAAYVSGKPELALNDGGFATYIGGSGTEILTFKYTIAAGQDTPDLEITSATGSITDAGGFPASFAGISNTNLGIVVDTTAPTIASVVTMPASGGAVKLGGTAKIDLDFSEAVIVSGTPRLRLNDGGTATYNSTSSKPASGILEFDYVVAGGQSTTDLKITSVSLPTGASIKDSAGNAAKLTLTAAKANLGLIADGIAPKVSVVTKLPTTGDILTAGIVTITLKATEKLTVSGHPTLALNDGGVATYTGGSGTNALVFTYTATATQSTTDLKVTGINQSVVNFITDLAGNSLSSTLAANLNLKVNVFTFAHTTGGGGTWSTAADWSPNSVPGAGETALITKPGTYTVSTTANTSVAVLDTEANATVVVGGGFTLDVTSGTGAGRNAGKIDLANNAKLILSGGTSAPFVNSGGTLYASAAGSLVEIAGVVKGGVAEVGNGTVEITTPSSENVTFQAGGSGELELTDAVAGLYTGRVSGFGANNDTTQFIDFTQIRAAGATLSYQAANAADTSGTLTVTSGAVSASIELVGHFTSGNFHLGADVAGHVKITDPPASGLPLTDIGLLANYMAASFVTAAAEPGAAPVTVPQTEHQPTLAQLHT